MNNAFDILNCSTKFSKSPYNLALSPNTYIKYKQFIELFEEYVFSLKLVDGLNVVNSPRKTGFVGIVWALKNWLNMYDLIKEKDYGLKYILSYKISQDHLETFFSTVRSKGGYNNNPSAKEFKTSYKKLLVHHHVSGSQYGNCLPESMLSKSYNIPDSIVNEKEEQLEIVPQNQDHDYFNVCIKASPYVENVTEYIAGFVARKVIRKINCEICKTFLIDNDNSNVLIQLKNRNDALYKPSKDVNFICCVSERWIRSSNLKEMYKKNVINKLYIKIKSEVYNSIFRSSILDEHVSNQNLFTNHRDQLITIIITTFITLRLRHIANQQQKETMGVRKKFTKLILFRNE
ncbi:unnamed protein product [Macrosiphum euphorbiae]|nr:unnamed protein product [Macrosiphum euphorbiae]